MKEVFISPTEDLLDPKEDIVFKALLTAKNKDSEETLKALISAFTGREVTEVRVAENEPQGGNRNEKHIRLDVNCVFNGNQLANVEMTMDATGFEFIRLEQYVARLFGAQSTQGLGYQKFPEAYQISIIGNKIINKNDKEIINCHEMCNMRTKKPAGGKMHIIVAELKKIKEKAIEEMDKKESWAAYFAWMGDKSKLDELNKLISLEEEIEMAMNALRKVSDDELLRMEIISQQKLKNDWENDMATVRIESEARGEKNGKISVARNALNLGLPYESVSKITGLTVEEIKALRQ
jgi:predicted transposase/invertase (TIGR01784 family)